VAVIPPVAPVPAIVPPVVPDLAIPTAPRAAGVAVAARTPAPGATASTAAAQVSAPAEPATVVTVPAGSSLSDLMLAVYGQYNSQMMERVQAVNPQVTDPDVIIAGDRLRFPEKVETPGAGAGTEAR
jgi:nucleoid-associated protein YgaU